MEHQYITDVMPEIYDRDTEHRTSWTPQAKAICAGIGAVAWAVHRLCNNPAALWAVDGTVGFWP
jgi:hypothetical protein